MSNTNQNFTSKVQKFAGKLSSNVYLKSVSNGLMSVLSPMIIGALATLLSSIPIEVYQTFIINTGIQSILNIVSSVTLDVVSLYAAFFIAFKLSENLGEKGGGAAGAGLITLMSFLVVTPISFFDSGKYISLQYLGSQGLFVAIIVAVIATKIYSILLNRGLTIKMPDGVPPTVSKTFENLAPAVAIVFFFGLIAGLFSMTGYNNVHAFVYGIIQAPLTDLGGGYGALIVVILIGHLLWFVGIHGMMVVMPIVMGVWMPLGLENLAAFNAGLEPQNILHMGFWGVFVAVGGAGAGLGLALNMVLFSKSKRYKVLGKLAIPGAIFGINEPLIFGTPIILNPYMLVPFVGAPLINGTLTYFLMSSGIIPITNGFATPLGTPVVINALMQGSIIFVLIQLITITISVLIYYPFFRKIDRDAYKDEQKAEVE